MAVVPFTLTISLCLVFTFVIFFLSEHARGGVGGADRDSLLPLREETPRVASRPGDRPGAAAARASHCGCEDGAQPPCANCLRQSAGR